LLLLSPSKFNACLASAGSPKDDNSLASPTCFHRHTFRLRPFEGRERQRIPYPDDRRIPAWMGSLRQTNRKKKGR